MATPTITPSFVQWQVKVLDDWSDFDRSTSCEMENAFSTPALQSIEIAVPSKLGTNQQMLDLRQMTWASLPVRRCKDDTATTRYEYWDDEAWMPYCKYAQSLLSDATRYGRDTIGLYIGDNAYDIFLDKTNDYLMQINRSTMRKRPIRVFGSTTTAVDDNDDDDDNSIADDESMPVEFHCPIMRMPMSKPMIAADGHSYEKKAIERWLLTKNTSPVTGKPLAHTELTLNHNLRKLIRDHVDGKAAPSAPGAAVPGKKRMRMCAQARSRGEGSSSK